MTENGKNKVWYPGAFVPQLYFIDDELRGIAAASMGKHGARRKWEAFDIKKRNVDDTGPLLLGEHETVELAREQIERLVV